MNLSGKRDDIMGEILRRCPEAEGALRGAGHIRGQLLSYQAAALYWLTRQFDHGEILEIGTLVGYSAALMAQAAPHSRIVTLNPAMHEVFDAKRNLEPWRNVEVVPARSWEQLIVYEGPPFDMIFVDGDHKRCQQDLPWWNWLVVGGLMLFHDYTREGSIKVVEAVDALGKRLGRDPDVLIVDDEGVGMAGFYRRDRDAAW